MIGQEELTKLIMACDTEEDFAKTVSSILLKDRPDIERVSLTAADIRDLVKDMVLISFAWRRKRMDKGLGFSHRYITGIDPYEKSVSEDGKGEVFNRMSESQPVDFLSTPYAFVVDNGYLKASPIDLSVINSSAPKDFIKGNIYCSGSVIGYAGKSMAKPGDLFVEGNIVLTGGFEKKEWNNVINSLPTDDADVLVLLETDDITTDWYNRRQENWSKCKQTVTHWMPFPSKPKA